MDNPTYKQKLLDQRWIDKSNRIKKERGFRCELCGRKDKKLHTHHGYYRFATDPWDYEDSSLWCLCWECHEKVQREMIVLHKMIGYTQPKDFFSLRPKISDATFEVQFGISAKEADQILEEENKLESTLYADYNVTLISCSELGASVSDQIELNASDEFPGIEIDIILSENDVDGASTVEGPDENVQKRIQSWFDAQIK